MGTFLKNLLTLLFVVLVIIGAILYLGVKSNLEDRQIQRQATAYRSLVKVKFEWEGGNGYSYVRGRVTNQGGRTIKYWKVKAYYKDKKGQTLDQDYQNSTETLLPGNSQTFQIMHREDPLYKAVSLEVDEVMLQ